MGEGGTVATENGKSSDEAAVEALSRSVGSIRVAGTSIQVDRWLMIVGGALVVLGIPAIILGWYGAARTPYVFEQIPYLISGGLLGLALAMVGSFFYFAYWLTRQIQETRAQGDRTEAIMQRLEAILTGGMRVDAPAAAPSKSFYATARGSMFHRADCAVVKGRKDLRTVTGDERGMQPCGMCDPLGTPARS